MIAWLLLAAGALSLPADLDARVKAYDKAQLAGNVRALDDLLDDSYQLLGSSGRRQSKSEVIGEYRLKIVRLKPFKVQAPFAVLRGDTAVVGGRARLMGTYRGRPFDVDLLFSDIWVKRGGKWRVIYTHASRAPGQSK